MTREYTTTNTIPYRFEVFSTRNRRRCEAPNGFNHKLDAWSTSDWMVALVGEVGEAANIVKKMNRLRDNIPNRKGEDEPMLRAELARELADVFTYLDLLAQSLGLDLLDEAEAKFDEVSQEIGYPVLPDGVGQYDPLRAVGDEGFDPGPGLFPTGGSDR